MGYLRLFIVLCFLGLISTLKSQSFTNNVSEALPSFFTTEIELEVSGLPEPMNGIFGLENVCIDIFHTFVSDITLWLRSPGGTQILLSKRNGGSGDNYSITCFTGNTSDILITSGNPPFNGNYQPEEPLGTFNNGVESPNGIWTLIVNDAFTGDDGVFQSLTLTFGDSPAVIPMAENDECSQATQLEINNNYTCNLTTFGTLSGASASAINDPCGFGSGSFDDDVWFNFQATTNRHEVVLSNIQGSTQDFIFAVYSGFCNSLSHISCFDPESFTLDDLIIGNNYFIRAASKSVASENVTFAICVKEGIPDPPVNDECSGALDLPSCNDGVLTASVAGATASSNNESCNQDGGFTNDVWFKFVASATSQIITINNISGTTKDLDIQLSTSNSGNPCSNLKQEFCFFDPNQTNAILIEAPNLTVGKTYFLRVATFNQAPQNTSFDICLDSQITPPVNDECANAILLTQLPSNCNQVTGTIYGATGSSQVSDCDYNASSPFDDDVWFYFIATQTAHNIRLLSIQGTTQDLTYQVLEGSCSSSSSFFCQDDPNNLISLTGLTIGEIYYLRVSSYATELENTSFVIWIEGCYNHVCDSGDSGLFTLRDIISCAGVGETITFDAALTGDVLFLEAPLFFNKTLNLDASSLNTPIILSNFFEANTSTLIDVNANVIFKNIKIEGKTTSSMKVTVRNNASLTLQE